jgi:peptidoglycan/LPS O-acetylase OafA/YrhL
MLVLGAHSTHASGFPSSLKYVFDWLFDGDLGVRFFFIISGFLITWLMICEHAHKGEVNLKHFYARRALRILPVYFAFLFVLLILELFTPYHQGSMAWIGNVTFTANYSAGDWVNGHLWSLSVEEQFYLIWPGLFVIFGLAASFRRAMLTLLVPVLLAPVSRVITNAVAGGSSHQIGILGSISQLAGNPESPFSFLKVVFNWFAFSNFFDSLALGAGCAFLLARQRESIQRHLLGSRFFLASGLGLLLIIVPYVLGHLHWVKWLTGPFGNTLQACGLGILLLQSVLSSDRGLYPALNWKWVVRIGVLSYSIYIWQQIFCANPDLFGINSVWWMSFPGWLLSVFIVASASYYCFERPILKLRAHLRDI